MKKWSILLIIVIFMAGCSKQYQPTIRLGLVSWIGYSPLYIAEAKGWLPKNIRIVDFPSNYDIIDAMKLDTLEASSLTLDEMLMHHKDLADYRAIWLIDYSNGADALLAAPNIKNLQDLKGKRVAYEPQSVQEFLLERALQKAHLSYNDIILKPVKYDQVLQAWNRHEIDAAATFEPLKSDLYRQGMHTVFDSSQIPYEIVYLLVVKKSELDRDTIAALIKAYNKGLRFIRRKPSDSYEIIGHYLHITPNEVQKALKGVHLLGCKENYDAINKQNILRNSYNTVMDFLLQQGYIHKKPHLHEVFSFAYMQRCKKR
ncbi:ABC transporter substrate-binding protein [Nitratiruptor sp. YY09-18]|uniref:ABC transporter substrate-binding protein n=1 Tax=Nitratiruptor sp. YY09-18 TaxID=2724901 RepID=UPI001916A417|nr:ABC transporter substrate-binding protein [Nitratiruptor sp. YY09-18]BCD68843.1 NitT/TauT family transport system substrate-binding protein [Nitratiruptor sp. YY09-18]